MSLTVPDFNYKAIFFRERPGTDLAASEVGKHVALAPSMLFTGTQVNPRITRLLSIESIHVGT